MPSTWPPRDQWGLSMAQCHLFYDLAIGEDRVLTGIKLPFTGNNYPAIFPSTTVVGLARFVLFIMKHCRGVRLNSGKHDWVLLLPSLTVLPAESHAKENEGSPIVLVEWASEESSQRLSRPVPLQKKKRGRRL